MADKPSSSESSSESSDKDLPMSEPITNLVLVGRTGNGKSATANTLLGQELFESKRAAGGVTSECTMYRVATPDGPILNVIDTPGLFDLNESTEILSAEIIKCLSMAKEGIHGVLFVLSTLTRFSQEEEMTLNALQRIFECNILDYFIVVFTGGDELERSKQTLDDYLETSPIFLENILRLSGQRKVLFDNRTQDENKKLAQLQQLLVYVDEVKLSTGRPYTDTLHRTIQEENEKLREKEREIDSRHLAEAEATAMKERSRMEFEQTMIMMQEMIERTLKISAEAHAKEMGHMREMFQHSQQHTQQQMQLLQQQLMMRQQQPPLCNIM